MKNCMLVIICFIFSCIVVLNGNGQDIPLEKITVVGTPDSYGISIEIPDSLEKSGKNGFFISKEGKKRIYITFMLPPNKIKKEELKQMISIYDSMSLIKENIVEIKGKRICGYSLVWQNEGLKKMSQYQTYALIFLDNSYLVTISIMSDKKDESELLGKLYSSIENSKIESLKDKNDDGVQQIHSPQNDAGKAPDDKVK